MGIRVTCAACQATFRVRDEFAGKKGRCPKCDASLRVPGTTPIVPPAMVGPPPAPPPLVPVHPLASDTAPSLNDAAPVITVDTDELIRRPTIVMRRAGRVRRWTWLAAAVLLVAATAGGIAFVVRGSLLSSAGAKNASSVTTAPATNPPLELGVNKAPFNPPALPQAADPTKPVPGAPLEDVVAYVKHGIVKIETSDGLNNRRGLGSGFVIDTSGLVATNYHVVSDASKADVLFSDGTRYGVEGYTAIDKHADLAILRLNGVPPDVKALELRYGDRPRDASQVYAIGHPQDNEFTTTGGIVGRVLRTNQLPTETRQWLTSTIDDSGDDLWIQHDAKISPGNSGGPLINAHGDVVGVNSWVNQKLGLGYAIHARHLHDLVARQEAVVLPLKQHRRSMPEPAEPQLTSMRGVAEQIKQLRHRLAAQGWRPQTADDCASFDELARTITEVKYVQAHPGAQTPMPLDEQQALLQEADEVVDALQAVSWKVQEQILPINAHAGKDRAPYGGVFLFGRVKKLFLGDDMENAALIQVEGTDEQFFLPLDDAIAGVKEEGCVLVLGIAHPSKVRVGDNPLKPTKVPILLSKVVLPLAR
ncbi:MAG TPA: trypsin-like peptidase domain-containing protein [Pirellulales bacterium]|jgi:S1-C subfamily serine protease